VILIYVDSDPIEREWLPTLALTRVEITHSLDQYIASQAQYKLAFTAHRMHLSHDPLPKLYHSFEHKIQLLSDHSDLVFCIESELHNYHWHMYAACHAENVYWCQPGLVNDRPDMQEHIIFWGDFFKLPALLYKKLPNKLNLLTPYDSKPKYFDALLGSPKPHRDFICAAVQRHELQEKIVMTYGGTWDNNVFYAKDYFLWEPDCVPEQAIIGTADSVNYLGHSTPLSHVMPIDVFNNTAYSIVAETDHDNTLSFFSEKTAKVLIARRLFVAFSGYRFLHNLRAVGFRTFDGIIDESYDLIEDDTQRYAAAFDQVLYLCGAPQSEILDQIRHIVDHNHHVIMTTDWTKFATDQVRIRIHSLLG
jgi:hypothetical protein